MTPAARVRGFATGDLLLLFGTVALLLALALPGLHRSQVRREAEAAATAVDSVRAAAFRHHERTGGWPASIGLRGLPAELAAALPDTAARTGAPYRLDWRVWELLEEADVDAPPPERPTITATRLPDPDTVPRPPPTIRRLAGVIVHTADPRILAELLTRYAAERSFVRDSTWTLLLGPDAGAR